ncbi:MAG: dienelactone hydrolase family protein [Ilumatobacter sp.]|uniref:dienelactone hydrolase family protein n=1 Tax=Ilumatobacter sp. TaxID=1967498 RepID=UPI00329A472B
MSDADDVLDGWERSEFASAGITHDVYRRGTGPAVVVIHEIPGITPKVTTFANEVVERGFTVVMPDLVGTPGKELSNTYAAASMVKVCVAREFATLAMNQTSPVIAWLRALARSVHAEVGGPGVGAVGMCFSGGFALGMMVDEIMLAPVLSQPSMPFAIGKARGADLNLSPDDEAAVIQRAADGCQVLGLRFAGDKLVGDRFATLRQKLGDAFIAVELPSSSRADHSVLTEQRDDRSVERVLDFFVEKLQTEPAPS